MIQAIRTAEKTCCKIQLAVYNIFKVHEGVNMIGQTITDAISKVLESEAVAENISRSGRGRRRIVLSQRWKNDGRKLR